MIVVVALFIANNLFSSGNVDTMFLGLLQKNTKFLSWSAVQLNQYGNWFDIWLDGLKDGAHVIHPVGNLD